MSETIREELNQILLSTPSHQHDYIIGQFIAHLKSQIEQMGNPHLLVASRSVYEGCIKDILNKLQ